MDYIEQGKLSVAGVRFFVLDEADRLLDTGNQVLYKQTEYCRMPDSLLAHAAMHESVLHDHPPAHATTVAPGT
jgi:superfamily II DNA/RNA helicase